jgi:hypothetical protein
MWAVFLTGIILWVLLSFIASIRDPRSAWRLIIIMILFTGFAVQVERGLVGASNNTWVKPIQEYRAELFLATSSFLFLTMLAHIGKVRFNNIPVQGAMLLAIQLLSGFLRFSHGEPAEGAKSLVFAIVTMLPILALLPVALDEWDDWRIIIRAIGFACVLWAGATFVQVLINHRELQVGYQSRFSGLLGNPQGCGLYMAPMTFSLLWLLGNDKVKKYWLLWLGTLSVMIVYSMWTGSRTCIIVTACGALFVLYSRIGRFVLILPILGVLMIGVYQIAISLGLSTAAVERLASTQNTRGGSWEILMQDFFLNPVFGIGFSQTRANENSYLLAFVAYGFGCGILVLVFLFYSLYLMARLWTYRAKVPVQHRQIVDLILGFNAAYFLGAIFEWHIVSRMEGNITYMMIFSVLANRLMVKVDREASIQDLYADTYESYGLPERSERPQGRGTTSTA